MITQKMAAKMMGTIQGINRVLASMVLR